MPRTRRAFAFVSALLALALVSPPSVAAAEAFQRDQTPLPASVTGGGGEGGDEPEVQKAASGGSAFARMVVGLAIVLAVIYGVYWLLKTYGKSRARVHDGGIGVVATAALASNRSVHLLRLGDEYVLVGAGEHSVTPIRVYGLDEARRLGITGEEDAETAKLRSLAPMGGQSPAPRAFLEELRRRTAR